MEKNQMQLIKKSKSYKLIVTQELEKQIRFLCDKLPRNEWSGTLFYTVEGSFKDDNLCIICKDFFLQDVGESTYTEFKNDVNLAGYMASHELWDCYTGLMHSHNNFSAFFSGTDINTLKEEGAESNHFVSLIVNNAGVYAAAITRKVSAVSVGTNVLTYNTFNNVAVDNEPESFEEESSYIEYYPLEITREEVPVIPKSELELRLEEVQKSSNSYVNRKAYTSYQLPIERYKSDIIKKPEEKTYAHPYLFSDEEMGTVKEEKKEEKEEENYLDPSIAYDEDHINPTILNNTVMQIITGDIFSIYKQNVDLNKWASNMEKLYSKRFENQVSEYDSFQYWVDSYLEFLENEMLDDDLFSKGRDYMDAIWAYDVISKLEEFPKNKYMDIFIESLERWLI